MSNKLISGAVAADAQIANTIEAPAQGAHVGGGRHVVIPGNWLVLSMAGNPPPGCTAATINPDGTMRVTNNVQVQLLNAPVQTAVTAVVGAPALSAFNVKVAAGSVVP
jgi:hypothetical protein